MIKSNGEERVVYESRLFEVCKQPVLVNGKPHDFEIVRRPPGVRLIVVKDKNILITKEFRFELGREDHRLPGGKVFDSIAAYRESTGSVLDAATQAAVRECAEETGLRPTKILHTHTTVPGALVFWDLYYFVVDAFEEEGQALSEGERITRAWKSFADVREMCLDGRISEERTVAVLLRFLEQRS